MLDEIVAKTKERLEESKKEKSLEELKKEVRQLEITQDFPFKKALSGDEISIIAEVKRASLCHSRVLGWPQLKAVLCC